MFRPIIWCIPLCCSTMAAQGQTVGLMAGVTVNDLHAGGRSFSKAQGLRLGAFLPILSQEHFILRVEAGVVGFQGNGNGYGEVSGKWNGTLVTAGLLGRYYFRPKASVSLGTEWTRGLQAPPSLLIADEVILPARMDLSLLFGGAYRFSDRVEVGARYGQGLVGQADLPIHGVAHRRSGSFIASYLLSSRHPTFATRRQWRNPNSSRY